MEPCNYPACNCPGFEGGSVLCSAEQGLRSPKPGVYLITTGGSSRRVGDSLEEISDSAAAALLGCATLRYPGYIGELNTLGRAANPKASSLLGGMVCGGVLLEYAA